MKKTLASPIEEELNGLENLLYFSSKSDNTGGYSLSLTFKSLSLIHISSKKRKHKESGKKYVETVRLSNGIRIPER